MPGMTSRIKLKKGRALIGHPNVPPVVVITAFSATPSIGANPDTGFFGTASDSEQGDLTPSIVWRVVSQAAGAATSGLAAATVSGGPNGTDGTSIVAGDYDFDVTLDGGSLVSVPVTVGGSNTYDSLAVIMSAALTGGSVSFVAGSFIVESATTGLTSTVILGRGTGAATDGDLFAAIESGATVTITFPTPVAGGDGSEVTVNAGTGGNPSLNFAIQGVQNVYADITDGFGVTVTDTQSVTVGA